MDIDRLIDEKIKLAIINTINNVPQYIDSNCVDTTTVTINNRDYQAIDDVFKSVTGNYYMEVLLNNDKIQKVNINNIGYCYSEKFDFENIKTQSQRSKKINRIQP